MESTIDELLPTRQSLLGRIKNAQDQEGWHEFFHTYWKLIYSVAIKAGLDDSSAQDVVQETVIGVAKSIQRFDYDPEKGSFKSWLLSITRRRINDHWRRHYGQPSFLPSADADSLTPLDHRVPDENCDWETLWNHEWERNLIAVALEKVKAKVKVRQYQLFDCFVLKEWPADVIRKKLGASLAQIYFAKYKVSSILEKELRGLRTKWETKGASHHH